jgi:hypothetical protein
MIFGEDKFIRCFSLTIRLKIDELLEEYKAHLVDFDNVQAQNILDSIKFYTNKLMILTDQKNEGK